MRRATLYDGRLWPLADLDPDLAQHLTVSADSKIDSVDPEIREQLTALVEAWIDAEVQSNRTALEEILHEDFLSTFASGTTLDRASYIDFIIGLDISPFKVRNESMVQHGDTVVVIDISESGVTKFTWIAVSRNDQWKVIAQTFSSIEVPRAEAAGSEVTIEMTATDQRASVN